MDVITSLASNPLPTSVAAVVAIAACLGYYFFVIPLIDDHKKLKRKHDLLLSEMEEGSTGKFIAELKIIKKAITEVNTALAAGISNNEEKLKLVEQFFAEMTRLQATMDREHEDLYEETEKLAVALQRLTEFAQTSVASSKARDDSLDRLLSDVNRNMHNINEKQSQILGALLGMGRIQDRNRGI